RDTKPANIMVARRREAKVMDFGLANKDRADAESSGAETVSGLSHRGEVIGTAAYMSPEQARGEPLDPRSDLFSVGVLLYEMVSGQRPFQGLGTSPPGGRGAGPLEPGSDLFSVGVLLYEMVSGQRPFQGLSTAAMAAAILTHEPLPLARFAPRTPSELERIVTKLLKKQPENRYQTAKDLLNDLRTLKGEQEFQLRLGRTP